ncbi:MAG: Glu-tRNA(Gln) amidotransferase subunit GatE [Thermoplasmatota archaeon]
MAARPNPPLPEGLLVGLEIHQQLDTPKLFCSCRGDLVEEVDLDFRRNLRPTSSELGEVDRAALAEARRGRSFRYEAPGPTACLVEMDEEPPHSMTGPALDAALEVSLLLGMRPVDEVHVMRKIVIDGSNTSGFQRTSLLATGGAIETSGGRIGIATLCLEEDAARKIGEEGGLVTYRLDRLGIPLVEIATDPDIHTPEVAREAAEAIGLALRSTGKVKRGLGTIRQDLNVSIPRGARVEIKGVQELRLLPLAVAWEARRQEHLLHTQSDLAKRGASAADLDRALIDITDLLRATESKVVRPAIDQGGVVLALALPRFGGLIGAAQKDAPRLGRELADYAIVAAGVKGLFHSDELPAYGITAQEVASIRERLALVHQDGFLLVAASKEKAVRALEAARERAKLALVGVIPETREVREDGSSRFLRPLPGGARMYPETDVPPVPLPVPRLAKVKAALPEMIPQKAKRFEETFGISAEEARTIARGAHAKLFETLAKDGQAREAARVLVHIFPETGEISEAALVEVFARLKRREFAKEALPDLIARLAKGESLEAAIGALGLGGAGGEVQRELDAEVDRLLQENDALLKTRGAAAAKPLMGPLMQKFRGRVSGEDVSRALERKIRERLGSS